MAELDAQLDALDAEAEVEAEMEAEAEEEAYPDTDAQYPDTDAQYPDTDAELKATAPPPKARWRPPDWSKLPVMHKPRLEMFENGRSARSMTVGNSRCFVFGRNGQVADIVVPDNSLSRAHAALINSSSATFIQDLDSAHGTYVDFEGRSINVPQLGTRLKAGEEPTKLTEGATIRFGSSNAVFRIVGLEHDVVQKWEPPRWAEPPSKPCHLEVRSHAFSNPYLSHLADEEGGDADELFALTGRCTLLGRSAAAVDVVLKDASISRQHAAVIHADGAAFLQDLGSASGSFVDGVQVAANKAHALAEGAVITLGECKTTYTYRLTAKGTGAIKRKR